MWSNVFARGPASERCIKAGPGPLPLRPCFPSLSVLFSLSCAAGTLPIPRSVCRRSVCRVSMAPRLPAMLARASVCALLWASSLISVYAIRPDSGSLALSRALSGALSSVYPTSTSRGSEVSAPLREGRVLLGEADHSYKVHEAVPLYANKGV